MSHERLLARGWLLHESGEEAVLLASDGRTPAAGAGCQPGGYVGWIWVPWCMVSTRLVQTETVPTLDDACRAAEELLRAGGPSGEGQP